MIHRQITFTSHLCYLIYSYFDDMIRNAMCYCENSNGLVRLQSTEVRDSKTIMLSGCWQLLLVSIPSSVVVCQSTILLIVICCYLLATMLPTLCSLYIPHISFFDQYRITKATLFELNYLVHFILESCCNLHSLCIPTLLHVSRVFQLVEFQEAGLLSEPSDSDSEQFFGHCRAHTKSELLKKRKKNFLQHQLHYR